MAEQYLGLSIHTPQQNKKKGGEEMNALRHGRYPQANLPPTCLQYYHFTRSTVILLHFLPSLFFFSVCKIEVRTFLPQRVLSLFRLTLPFLLSFFSRFYITLLVLFLLRFFTDEVPTYPSLPTLRKASHIPYVSFFVFSLFF